MKKVVAEYSSVCEVGRLRTAIAVLEEHFEELGKSIAVNSIHAMIEPLKPLFPDKNLNPKSIRMSVICNWLNEKNLPLEQVQELAGHKWPGTTEKYFKADNQKQRELINMYFPIT
jgi:integrase/recombinase XerD